MYWETSYGRLDEVVYKRIGQVYKRVAEMEPWCRDGVKVSEIALVTAKKELCENAEAELSDEGALRMLLELKQPFDIIGSQCDLSKYRLVVLPDSVRLDHGFARKIIDYVEKGGALILSSESGLKADENKFASELFGVSYTGEAQYSPDYVRIEDKLGKGIEPIDYCFYEKGTEVKAHEGSEILALIRAPYFNRTWDRFCSHCQTPPGQLTDSPAIVKNGNVIYISKPIFRDYIKSGTKVYRDIIRNCMQALAGKLLIETDLPSTAEVTLYRQNSRYILHVLNYIPQKNARKWKLLRISFLYIRLK